MSDLTELLDLLGPWNGIEFTKAFTKGLHSLTAENEFCLIWRLIKFLLKKTLFAQYHDYCQELTIENLSQFWIPQIWVNAAVLHDSIKLGRLFHFLFENIDKLTRDQEIKVVVLFEDTLKSSLEPVINCLTTLGLSNISFTHLFSQKIQKVWCALQSKMTRSIQDSTEKVVVTSYSLSFWHWSPFSRRIFCHSVFWFHWSCLKDPKNPVIFWYKSFGIIMNCIENG